MVVTRAGHLLCPINIRIRHELSHIQDDIRAVSVYFRSKQKDPGAGMIFCWHLSLLFSVYLCLKHLSHITRLRFPSHHFRRAVFPSPVHRKSFAKLFIPVSDTSPSNPPHPRCLRIRLRCQSRNPRDRHSPRRRTDLRRYTNMSLRSRTSSFPSHLNSLCQ